MTFATATIQERIRSVRILRGLSQRNFGRAVKVQQDVVWKWENGKSQPRPETLLKIAAGLGVNMLWLTFGEGPMNLPSPEKIPSETPGT